MRFQGQPLPTRAATANLLCVCQISCLEFGPRKLLLLFTASFCTCPLQPGQLSQDTKYRGCQAWKARCQSVTEGGEGLAPQDPVPALLYTMGSVSGVRPPPSLSFTPHLQLEGVTIRELGPPSLPPSIQNRGLGCQTRARVGAPGTVPIPGIRTEAQGGHGGCSETRSQTRAPLELRATDTQESLFHISVALSQARRPRHSAPKPWAPPPSPQPRPASPAAGKGTPSTLTGSQHW